MKEEYCTVCGARLYEKYAEDTVTIIGWQCNECVDSWTFQQHETDRRNSVLKIKELKLKKDEQDARILALEARLAIIEESLGL